MDKSSIIELQRLDCNCNDCISLVRDLDRFKKSLDDHYRWQFDYFTAVRNNLYQKAEEWSQKGFPYKARSVWKEANKLKFQFDKKEALINYGQCTKFKKDVSFIPNVLQLDTQECFIHRRI